MKSRTNKVKINYLFYGICIYLIISLYLKQDDTYMAFLVICMVAAITSIIHIMLCKRLIKLERLDSKEIIVSKNNRVEVIMRVHNKMWIQTPYIYVFMNTPLHLESLDGNGVCIAIQPRGYKDIKFTYNAKYSGSEMITLDKVIVQDYIGICRNRAKLSYEKVINILPEIVNMKRIGRITKNISTGYIDEGKSKNNGLGEPSYDLAPYKKGDSMKLVHWKLLARRNVWMVREREQIITEYKTFTLIIDPVYVKQWDRARIIDKTVNVVITMASHILDRGDEVAIVYNILGDWESMLISNRTELISLGKILSQYNGVGKEVESRWPNLYLDKIGKKNSAKIFITPKLDLKDTYELEKDTSVEVLTIIPSTMLEDSGMKGWYLSGEYEVNRYV